MGRFDSQIATAKRAILKNGELCTWRAPTAVTPNVGEPWKPVADTPVDHEDIPILFLPSNSINALVRYLKGTEVTTGSTSALMASVSFVPLAKDVVIRADGSELRIKTIDPLSPNGQIILYTIEFDQ
jgi:hypothetical protein